MYKFMEDNEQYYHQCVTEVKKCKLLSVDLRDSTGPVAIGAFNDDPLAKIQPRLKVGYEMEGDVRSFLFMKN